MAAMTECISFAVSKVGRSLARTFSSTNVLNTQQETYVDTNEVHGVRTITLNHAASRNSLSVNMIDALLTNITKDEHNDDLRSIVITSLLGKMFCSGHNLKELATNNSNNQHKEIFDMCSNLMQAITRSPVPIIAKVDGLAAAAGCQLVAACDIAVCTERSSFSTPGANVGIFCSTPGIPLVRNVPRKLAAYMLFTGFSITGKEAYEAGLVSKVVANDELEDEVNKITEAINSKSRSVVHFGKQFLYEQLELDIATAYSLGTERMIHNLKLKDAREGIKSFFEKRKPNWSHSYENE